MPQFDFSTFEPQLIWLAMSFIVLYCLMAGLALPRIARVLEERQDRIDDNLQKAGQLKTEADAAAEVYNKSVAEAQTRAHQVLIDAAQHLSQEAAQHQDALSQRLATEIEAAEARIAVARTDAITNIRAVSTEVARQAAEILTGESIEEGAVTAAIDAALTGRS